MTAARTVEEEDVVGVGGEGVVLGLLGSVERSHDRSSKGGANVQLGAWHCAGITDDQTLL